MISNLQNMYRKPRLYTSYIWVSYNTTHMLIWTKLLFAIVELLLSRLGLHSPRVHFYHLVDISEDMFPFIYVCQWEKNLYIFCFLTSCIISFFALLQCSRIYPSACFVVYKKIYVQIILSTCVSVSFKRPSLSCLSV